MRRHGAALSVAMLLVACTRNVAQEKKETDLRAKATNVQTELRGLERTGTVVPTLTRYPVRWSPQLGLDSLGDIDRRLQLIERDSFGELSKNSHSILPQNCTQWLQLHGQGYASTNTVEEQPNGAARIRCTTLELLRSATPARKSAVRDFTLDERALSVLPASIATLRPWRPSFAVHCKPRARAFPVSPPSLAALEYANGDSPLYIDGLQPSPPVDAIELWSYQLLRQTGTPCSGASDRSACQRDLAESFSEPSFPLGVVGQVSRYYQAMGGESAV